MTFNQHPKSYIGVIWGFNNLFRGFAVVCGSEKGDKTPNFHEFMPETLVNLGWPNNVHRSTNPKTVLMCSKHEIHPFRMFWCVLPVTCDLPWQYYRIWNFALRLHIMHVRHKHQMWPLSGRRVAPHIKTIVNHVLIHQRVAGSPCTDYHDVCGRFPKFSPNVALKSYACCP